jgi:Na+/proline symporter
MTTLSAEYNVTAGVLTHDIYRRLLRPAAGEREQRSWRGWPRSFWGR